MCRCVGAADARQVLTHSGCICRSLECEKDILTRASGSVRWKQGGTEILAAVHGPQPALQRKAQADRAVVEVVLRPRFGLPGMLLIGPCYSQARPVSDIVDVL